MSILVIVIIIILVIIGILYIYSQKKKETTNSITEPFALPRGVYCGISQKEDYPETDITRVVYFGKPSCPFCVKYNPIWDAAVAALKPDFPDLELTKIDISEGENRNLMERETEGKANTVPCVMLVYKNGKKVFLNGNQRNHLEMYVRHTEGIQQ